MPIKELVQQRKKITTIDEQIISLLEERLHVIQEISAIKEKNQIPLTDAGREKELLKILRSKAQNPLLKNKIDELYQTIIAISKQQQIQARKPFSHPVTIGIIGYGRFGQLLETIFKKHWKNSKVRIVSSSQKPDQKRFFEMTDLKKCDLVIPCVPISSMETTLKKIREHLSPTATVVDVCSVKLEPVAWMKKILGKGQSIIATHPMFGPDSTKNGTQLLDLNMMIHNVSAPEKVYGNYKTFWSRLGVRIVEITPDRHDRYAAYTINYNHLIGRIGEEIGIRSTPIDTKGFSVIFEALSYVVNDSWQLFRDMQVYNPYAKKMRKEVLRAVERIEEKLQKKESKV